MTLELPPLPKRRSHFVAPLLVALGLSIAGGCAWWSKHAKAAEDVVLDCSKQAALEATVAILPTVLAILTGESLDNALTDLKGLGVKAGVGVVTCAVQAVQNDLAPSPASSQPVIDPVTAQALGSAAAYLKTAPAHTNP